MTSIITTLTIDKRESKVIPHLETEFEMGNTFNNNCPEGNEIIIDYEAKQIEVGDYIISSKIGEETVVHACIERKSLKDLSASIKDGRLGNIEKIKKLREETGCHLILLIEGPVNPNYETEYSGIKFSKILASIDSLMIKFDLKIIQTLTHIQSAKRLKFLTESYARNYARNEMVNQPKYGSLDEPLSKATFSPEEKEVRSLVSIWSCFKGITTQTAYLLASNFTLKEFLIDGIEREKLTQITNPKTGRKLITRQINAILAPKPFLLNSDDGLASKFLSKFPGISLDGARNMVFSNQLEQILKMDKIELSKVPVSSSRKLGPKKAETLIDYLNKKIENGSASDL